MSQHLEEKKLSGETIFKGHLLDVRKDKVLLPNGNESAREYIVHPGAVVVLPISARGTVFFVRQFRYPLGKVILELPAGKIDPGENCAVTAARELAEEIGGVSSEWSHAGGMFPCVGYSNERIEMYLAKNVTLGARAELLDEDEFIDIVEMTPAEIRAALDSGELDDGKTVLLLYKFAALLGI